MTASSSGRVFVVSEDDLAVLLKKPKLGAVQGIRQTKSLKKGGPRTGCVFTEFYSVCEKLNLLRTIISICLWHRDKSQVDKLQKFFYQAVSWQYFACNDVVYVTLIITELRRGLLFRRLFPCEKNDPKLSLLSCFFEYLIINLYKLFYFHMEYTSFCHDPFDVSFLYFTFTMNVCCSNHKFVLLAFLQLNCQFSN